MHGHAGFNYYEPEASAFPLATTDHTSKFGQGSLYIRNLDKAISEDVLFNTFSEFGLVHSVKICTDNVTTESLGYGYINFTKRDDAQRVLETKDGLNIGGRSVRLTWSQRHKNQSKYNPCNIFVNQLPADVGTDELMAMFTSFGTILTSKIATDREGVSKGYGFVNFEAEESALSAIESGGMGNVLCRGTPVTVAPYRPKNSNGAHGGRGGGGHHHHSNEWTNCYVKNLPQSWDEDKVRSVFEVYGPITSFVIMKDETGKSRGFGFVNFVNHDHAKSACEALTGTFDDSLVEMKGDIRPKMVVTRAQRRRGGDRDEYRRGRGGGYSGDSRSERSAHRAEKYAGLNVYIRNIDDNVTDDMLKSIFGVYGTIASAIIMRRDDGSSRNFGFVCYTTADEANMAVASMNNQMIEGKAVYVALALRKDSNSRRSSNNNIGDRGHRYSGSRDASVPHHLYNTHHAAPMNMHHPYGIHGTPSHMMSPMHDPRGAFHYSPMMGAPPSMHGGHLSPHSPHVAYLNSPSLPSPSMIPGPSTSGVASAAGAVGAVPEFRDEATLNSVCEHLYNVTMGKVGGDHATAVSVVQYLRLSMEIPSLTQLLNEPETFDAKLAEMRVPLAAPMDMGIGMAMTDAAPVGELLEGEISRGE